MQQAIEKLEKARDLLLEVRESLSEQIPGPRQEMPGYKTKQAIHWTEAEIRKLKRQEKEEPCKP